MITLSHLAVLWLPQREEFKKLKMWRAEKWKPKLGKGIMERRRRACIASVHSASYDRGRSGFWSKWVSLSLAAAASSIGMVVLLTMRSRSRF